MPNELVMRETARWLRYSREDLDAAVALQSRTYRHSCLLAQQSSEKAIKSIYVFLDLRVPRSHDLDMLRTLLPDGWDVKTRFENLSELSLWAIESRYPGNMPESTRVDADAAITLAKRVLCSVEEDLRTKGFVS